MMDLSIPVQRTSRKAKWDHMAKASAKNKTLSTAVALAMAASLSVPFTAYADEDATLHKRQPSKRKRQRQTTNPQPTTKKLQQLRQPAKLGQTRKAQLRCIPTNPRRQWPRLTA